MSDNAMHCQPKMPWLPELPAVFSRLLAYFAIGLLIPIHSGCERKTAPIDPLPEHLELTIDSNCTGETRRVNVYLPPGYADGQSTYPVVYMPDGGIGEDFPHIANTLETMIKDGSISPVILVGVENTNRKRDLTGATTVQKDQELIPDAGGAGNFRNFFRDELRPEIEQRFRTSGDTAIVGESLAGLFVVETLVTEPGLFDRYIAFDPSIWWNGGNLVAETENVVGSDKYSKTVFWFASSDATDIVVHVEKLASVLESSAADGMNWHYASCPNEKHSTIFRAEKENAFRWGLWKPNQE